jgi:hypothetical protein
MDGSYLSGRRVPPVAHTAMSLRYLLEYHELLKPHPGFSFAITQAADDFGHGVDRMFEQPAASVTGQNRFDPFVPCLRTTGAGSVRALGGLHSQQNGVL